MVMKLGDAAPDFTLPDADRKPVTLSSFAGKSVVLAFIPGAFTSVCTKELCSFQSIIDQTLINDAQVLAIDVDAPFVNRAFADAHGIKFPLLSDYARAVTALYGGLHHDFAGLSGYSAPKRAVFVIDPGQKLAYQWISENPGAEPPYDEINAALATSR